LLIRGIKKVKNKPILVKTLIPTCLKHCLPTYLAAILCMLALAFGSVNSELMAQPSLITVDGVDLYTANATKPETTIDSATIGATLPYYIYPDVNFNPLYNPTSPFANIESSFAFVGAAGYTISDIATHTSATNYKNITWNTLGSYTITVNETAAATYGGCTGSSTFDVKVINKPTAAFTNAGVLICPNSTTVDLPITVATDIAGTTEKQMQFAITCTKGGTAFDITGTDGKYAEGTGTTTVTATAATGTLTEGIYTFTLSSVSDRISRKCAVSGTLGTQTTYTVYVFAPKPTIKTSAIK
jgi:hypothetical protein